jgi:hypothetical protein
MVRSVPLPGLVLTYRMDKPPFAPACWTISSWPSPGARNPDLLDALARPVDPGQVFAHPHWRLARL